MYTQYLMVAAPAAMQPALVPAALIHPSLWRAHQLGRTQGAVWPSHFAALDAQLPGGGWPAGVLTELLLPHAGVGELRLLAPLLTALQAQQRSVMWFDPPAAPCPWALAALGLDMQQLVLVQSRAALQDPLQNRLQNRARGRVFNTFNPSNTTPQPTRKLLPAADVLWALEQALKSGHLGAVLAWLPARLPADALRRLQLAAQAHDGPAFLLRDASMRTQPSAAPLRLLLGSAGPDMLRVTVLKRRGPPLAQALTLALPAVLSAPALARALRGRDVPQPAMASASTAASGTSPQPLRVETVV